jgi:hypothetical protein
MIFHVVVGRALNRSRRAPASRGDLPSDKRALHNLCALSEQKQNLESRAKERAG